MAQFQSPIVIGPLQISDLAATVAWGRQPDLPVVNSESAFGGGSFQRLRSRAGVDLPKEREFQPRSGSRAILSAIDLTTVAKQDAHQPAGIQTGLMLSADQEQVQQAGGTWSEMFSYEWLWNKYPGLSRWFYGGCGR